MRTYTRREVLDWFWYQDFLTRVRRAFDLAIDEEDQGYGFPPVDPAEIFDRLTAAQIVAQTAAFGRGYLLQRDAAPGVWLDTTDESPADWLVPRRGWEGGLPSRREALSPFVPVPAEASVHYPWMPRFRLVIGRHYDDPDDPAYVRWRCDHDPLYAMQRVLQEALP
jgi:hypothetical protein